MSKESHIRGLLLSYDFQVLEYDAGVLSYDTGLLAYDSHFIVFQVTRAAQVREWHVRLKETYDDCSDVS